MRMMTGGHELAQAFTRYRLWAKAHVEAGGRIKRREHDTLRRLANIFAPAMYPVGCAIPTQREEILLTVMGHVLALYVDQRCSLTTADVRDPFNPITRRVAEHSTHDPHTGCRLWTDGAVTSAPYAYPILTINKKQVSVRRALWEFYYGPIPRKQRVTTTCREPLCVAPEHLALTLRGGFVDGETFKRAVQAADIALDKYEAQRDAEKRIMQLLLSPQERAAAGIHLRTPEEQQRLEQAIRGQVHVKICRAAYCDATLPLKSRFVYCPEHRDANARRRWDKPDLATVEEAITQRDVEALVEEQIAHDEWDNRVNNVVNLDEANEWDAMRRNYDATSARLRAQGQDETVQSHSAATQPPHPTQEG